MGIEKRLGVKLLDNSIDIILEICGMHREHHHADRITYCELAMMVFPPIDAWFFFFMNLITSAEFNHTGIAHRKG